MALLTKSKYMIGLKCPAYLWMAINDKASLPEFDDVAKHRFAEGNEVGELAKQLFPKGIDIPTDEGFNQNISHTQDAMALKLPVFEAAIMHDRLYARADVLNPKGAKWDLYEVKSTTKVKPEHIHDVSFQKYCYELAGLKINKCYVLHLNNEYIHKSKLNIKALFTETDVTSKVEKALVGMQGRVKNMLKIIDSETRPKTQIHCDCKKPYVCPLMKDCWDFLPDENVFDLIRGGALSFDLFSQDILHIKDIPRDYNLGEKQSIQRKCAINSKTHVDKWKIKQFLDTLEYPLYHLDFETFQSAIPIFDNSKPYQQIPFQFSLHIENKDGSLKHHSFVASTKGDPRESFAKELKKVLGKKGSIIVYYQSFEKARLQEIAEALPKYAPWVKSVLPRVIDLYEPFSKFHYYNPVQKGSASIKKVLPAVTGKGYEGLEISGGMEASLAFIKLRKGVSKSEEAKIRKDLEVYCGLDTEAMIWIIQNIIEFIKD